MSDEQTRSLGNVRIMRYWIRPSLIFALHAKRRLGRGEHML